MSYGHFSKYDRDVVRVFQIHEHLAQIVKLGRYGLLPVYCQNPYFPIMGGGEEGGVAHPYFQKEVRRKPTSGLWAVRNPR